MIAISPSYGVKVSRMAINRMLLIKKKKSDFLWMIQILNKYMMDHNKSRKKAVAKLLGTATHC